MALALEDLAFFHVLEAELGCLWLLLPAQQGAFFVELGTFGLLGMSISGYLLALGLVHFCDRLGS